MVALPTNVNSSNKSLLSTEYWTSNMLGLPEKQAWHQWTYKADKHGGEQVGGMVTEYAGPLYFVTIKGAGHMVPQFKVIT
jgi:hypothetical protein